MKESIVIILRDSNLFFSLAMQVIIKRYFYAKGVTTIFRSIDYIKFADLVVTTSLPRLPGHERNRNIVIRKKLGEESYLQGEVSLREKIEAVEHLLDKMYEPSFEDSTRTILPSHRAITPRELEVLQGIAVELSPMQIASQLKISRKTVSSHKYTAMRKLGFSRTHDLYHWILQGGLSMEQGM